MCPGVCGGAFLLRFKMRIMICKIFYCALLCTVALFMCGVRADLACDEFTLDHIPLDAGVARVLWLDGERTFLVAYSCESSPQTIFNTLLTKHPGERRLRRRMRLLCASMRRPTARPPRLSCVAPVCVVLYFCLFVCFYFAHSTNLRHCSL